MRYLCHLQVGSEKLGTIARLFSYELGMKAWKLFFATLGVAASILGSGCETTQSAMPVPNEVKSATRIAVVDFDSVEADIGSTFSELLAMQLEKDQDISEVTRTYTDDVDIVVSGRILKSRKGSVPVRTKYGPGMGNAYLTVEVSVANPVTEEVLVTFIIDESTLWTGPDARRTGREGFDWLLKEVAKQVTAKLRN